MDRLEFAAFLERSGEFDEAVHREQEISTFCSGSVWQTAAFRSLHGGDEDSNFLILGENGNWIIFVEKNEGVYFPLESAWMFGCPLIGHPDETIAMLNSASGNVLKKPTGFVIPGVLKDGALHQKLREQQRDAFRYEEFPATDCMTIDLAEGVDAWLARRSGKFRKMIRQLRLPESFEIVEAEKDPPGLSMDRILAIQRKTYKWREGTDIFQGEEYVKFYGDILEQLHTRGDLRLLFGQVEGNDVAYIFGGVSGKVYRGFQMSYVEEMRQFGIGNHLQIENMKRMIAEGVTNYDLGMFAPYKERWADHMEQYVGVFIVL